MDCDKTCQGERTKVEMGQKSGGQRERGGVVRERWEGG